MNLKCKLNKPKLGWLKDKTNSYDDKSVDCAQAHFKETFRSEKWNVYFEKSETMTS